MAFQKNTLDDEQFCEKDILAVQVAADIHLDSETAGLGDKEIELPINWHGQPEHMLKLYEELRMVPLYVFTAANCTDQARPEINVIGARHYSKIPTVPAPWKDGFSWLNGCREHGMI